MRKSSWMLVITMTAAVFAVNGGAFAGTTNTLPYSDNFENYANGTPLINGTNGWYGDSSAIVVQNHTVRTGTNAAVIPNGCVLSNRFQSSSSTNVWIQMDLRPGLLDVTNSMWVDTNQAGLFFVNSNGNFVVHHGSVTNPYDSTNWVVLTNVGIGTSGTNWVRINIYEKYTQTNWDLYADGVLVTNNIGFVNTSLTNFWGFNVDNGTMTSYMDNVSVSAVNTNQYPLIVIPPTPSVRNFFVDETPSVQTVKLCNIWSGPIGFEITTNQAWISASPINGSVDPGTTNDVTLTFASTTSWQGGISNAIVTVVATNGTDRWGTQTVAVVLNIMDLRVSPSLVSNTVVAGATPTNRDFGIINAGGGSFSYIATITNDWLSFSGLSATNGTVSAFSTNTLTLTYSNTAWWTPGVTSNTTITIVSTDSGGATLTLNVALTPSMTLQTVPAQLANVVMQGETASTNFQVWSTNQGIANYAVGTSHAWLVVSPSAGSLTGDVYGVTNTIAVTYTNTTALTVGAHYGMITISGTGCPSVPINVTLTVQAPPMLSVSPTLVTNTVMAGQDLDGQTLQIWNGSTNYGIGYRVTTNVAWLYAQVTNNYLAPLTTNTLAITVGSLTSAGDVPSNYTGAITITATNRADGSPVTIPVTVRVNPKPRLAFNPTNLSQTILQGKDAVSQGFDIWNSNGYYTLEYTISKGVTPWLMLTPVSGTSTGQHQRIEVQYSTANLPAGRTNATITVVGWAWDGVHAKSIVETQTIDVALSVTPFATLTTDAESEYAYTVRKGSTPPDTVFSVWNSGNPPNSMYFTVSPSASWLSVTPSSGTSTGNLAELRVQADAADMKPGVVYEGTVQINAIDAESGAVAYGSPSTFTIAVVLREFKGFDFQGGLSGASDLVLYREADGAWEIRNLMSNYATTQFLGGAGYQAVPGDYTGEGVTWMGVYRPASGSWYAQQAGAGSAQVLEMNQWAGAEYVGVPGDYDGDGKTDPGVYLEQSGLWMLLLSGNGYQQVSGTFGGPGWTALLAGDYDGDCLVDPGVYNRASGLWVLLLSSARPVYSDVVSGTFGGSGFVTVPTDYDGDSITDPAIYETETGYWSILLSDTSSFATYQFGGTAMSSTLVPAPGNYDGAGGADLGLYDTTTWCWYIMTLDGVPLAWGYPMGRLGCFPVLP
ncbi:MAG: VCBS repeat-containing protein [Verrucomicrobiota bacterium]